MNRVAHRVGAAWRLLRHRRAAPGGVILAYHDVVAAGADTPEWAVTADGLGGHLRVLRGLGVTLVSLDDLAERHRRGEPVDGLAAITFDDALEGVLRHGVPVLAATQVPATVFVVTQRTGVAPPWWPGAASTLDRTGLDALAAAGCTLASHTRTHASLAGLDPGRLRDELAGSRADLAELTGRAPDALAYPFGHHDPGVRAAAAEAGYATATTFLNGRVVPGVDPFRLPRLTMGPHLSPLRLALHLTRDPNTWPDHQLDAVHEGGGGGTP